MMLKIQERWWYLGLKGWLFSDEAGQDVVASDRAHSDPSNQEARTAADRSPLSLQTQEARTAAPGAPVVMRHCPVSLALGGLGARVRGAVRPLWLQKQQVSASGLLLG